MFGKSKLSKVAADMGLNILGRIPIDSTLANLCDEGAIERADIDYLNGTVTAIENKLPVHGE